MMIVNRYYTKEKFHRIVLLLIFLFERIYTKNKLSSIIYLSLILTKTYVEFNIKLISVDVTNVRREEYIFSD